MNKVIEQAITLGAKINKALLIFNSFDGFEDSITESEISFRYQTIKGFLIIVGSDVTKMIRFWKKQDKKKEEAGDVQK